MRNSIWKKKVLAMVLTAVCAMGLMAGCGNSGNAATGTQNAATESGYKVGKFPSLRSMDLWITAAKDFWKD